MMKKKRIFPIKILLALTMALALLALSAVPALAQATATRTLPDEAVGVGAQFEVGIDADGFGFIGQVVETLPTGFTYVDGSATAVSGIEGNTVAEAVDGQNVTFTFLCAPAETAISFTYNVTAPDTAGGPFYFAGMLDGQGGLDLDPITGDTEVNVGEAEEGATATRTLPDEAVGVGAQFEVGIDADGFGFIGQVVETLPDGFTYVDGSTTAVSGIEGNTVAEAVDGQNVTFTFLCAPAETAISFTYNVTAPDTAGTFYFAGTLDGQGELDVDPITGDTAVNVGEAPPFTGSVAQGGTSYVTPIPAGATELEITLSAATDLDLNLYDGDTLVIGWKAIIDSPSPTTGTYEEEDTFAYSGWDGGEESILAGGPLSRAYDLKVYGFEAGDYTVSVSYVPAGPDITPPTITITAPDATVGTPTTIEVSATDPSGVAMIWFGVYPEEYPPEWPNGEHPIVSICTFTDSGSVTFVPGWAETYTVEAIAVDNQDNMTPSETTTFVVSE